MKSGARVSFCASSSIACAHHRPDAVLFVNGLPLAVLEPKNAAAEKATVGAAFQQLQTYQAQVPALLATNAVLVVSDGV